jgi:Exonuclease
MRTTGFDPLGGHRLVEIGAVELVNLSLTGQVFHSYLNPERAMPADAIAVHGLTAAFLADKPLFGAVADELLAFVGDAPLVAHNAGFDIAFLNAELKHAGKPPIVIYRAIDTLVLARRKRTGTCVMAKRPLHISEGFRSSNPRAQASTSFPFSGLNGSRSGTRSRRPRLRPELGGLGPRAVECDQTNTEPTRRYYHIPSWLGVPSSSARQALMVSSSLLTGCIVLFLLIAVTLRQRSKTDMR